MKKIFVWFLVIVLLAIISADAVYKKYQRSITYEDIGNVYFLQQGVYSNSKNIKNINASYITVEEDKKYYTYVGITTDKNNALKIKDYYEKRNIPIYIKSSTVENEEFINSLEQYDVLLSSCTDVEIPNILEAILSTYEEIFVFH